jgi:hypothetical protein
MAMDQNGRLCAPGKAQEMPGMLAFFEDPVFNDAAAVIGIEDAKRITHVSIGQVHGSPTFGDAIVPPPDDDGIDGLANKVASMG